MSEDLDASALKPFLEASPNTKGMLARINDLRRRAWVPPPHWSHTPSAAEICQEKRDRDEADACFEDLKVEVDRLREALLSPFVL